MTESGEIRPIMFAPGYEVSNEGRVFSKKWGRQIQLRPWPNGALGHLMVTLCVDGARQKWLVHRLVKLTFHGEPPEGQNECRHDDGNPTNNRLSNLLWGTHTDNMQDMVRHGRATKSRPDIRGELHPLRKNPQLACRGEASPAAKLTEASVRAIRSRQANGARDSVLAREYGVTPQLIFRIKKRLCWKHLADQGGDNG